MKPKGDVCSLCTAPCERSRTASPGAGIDRQPLTFTPYASSESLRGSGTLHFAQESPRVSPAPALARNGTAEPKGLDGNVARARARARVGVGGSDSQEIPDESRHKGGHPCLLAHAHSSSQPVSHAQVARLRRGSPNDSVFQTFESRAAFRCSCEQIFPPPRAASFLTMRWRDGGNLA